MKYLALIITGLFCALASYSYGKCCAPYTPPAPVKLTYKWKTKQDEQLASIYNLTPDSVAEPVMLWEEK